MPRRKQQPERRIQVRSVRRDPPDLRQLGRALIALAQAQAEADAQQEHQKAAEQKTPAKKSTEPSADGR